MSRSLSVFESVSVDGYFCDANQDMSWAYAGADDPEFADFTTRNAEGGGALVFGRVTYQMMASFWPTPLAAQRMPEVAERMNAMLDQVYNAFLERVAKGRKMTVAQVDKIAGGRVWPGSQAIQVGLVDEMGGLQAATDYTAKLLNAPDRFALDAVILPKPLTTFEEIMQFLGEQGAVYDGLRYQAALGHFARPVMDQMAVLGRGPAAYEPLRIKN